MSGTALHCLSTNNNKDKKCSSLFLVDSTTISLVNTVFFCKLIEIKDTRSVDKLVGGKDVLSLC